MYLIGLELMITIPQAYSLKDKRRVVKSIIERAQHRYKMTASQLSDDQVYNQATIGFGIITPHYNQGREKLMRVMEWIEESYDVSIINYEWIESL